MVDHTTPRPTTKGAGAPEAESSATDAPTPESPASTLLCMLLDRSGSMAAIKSDMDGGYDTFIADQRALGGECRVTLNQFDTEYECVYALRDVADVPPLDLHPRGATALLDAVGRTVTQLQHDVDAMSDDRPEKVIVVVLTDGFENSSVEWTYPAVKELVQSKQPAWDFVFIGADQDAVTEGAKLGVYADAAIAKRNTSESTAATFKVLSAAARRARKTGESLSFSAVERAEAMGHDDTSRDE